MQKLLPFRYDYLRERKNTHTHNFVWEKNADAKSLRIMIILFINKRLISLAPMLIAQLAFRLCKKKPATATTSNGIYEKRTKKKQSNIKSRTNTKKRTYQAGRSTTRNTYYVLITYYSVWYTTTTKKDLNALFNIKYCLAGDVCAACCFPLCSSNPCV